MTSSLLRLCLSWFCCVALAAQAPTSPGDAEGLPTTADRVTRHAITWFFDREHVIGTFANGDPWVLGPVRIVRITPESFEHEGRVRNGSMIDPDPTTEMQGYDSALFGKEEGRRYDPARNVAFGIGDDEPLELGVEQSLVSVVGREQIEAPPTLQTASVLTCLAAAPAPDAFRPPYVRGDKRIAFREADLDYSVLLQLKPLVEMPSPAAEAIGFERLWLDHFPNWVVRYSHPLDNMPDYGRDLAAKVASAGLLLNTSASNAEKRDLLVRFVQFGIDAHAVLRAGGRWHGLGGHGHGRKLPILMAGLVLHDDRMLAVGRDFVSKPTEDGGRGGWFGEDTQTFYVRETSPGVWNWGKGGYTVEHDGLPEWGFSHCDSVANDAVAWEENPYRRCCTANAWVGEVLVARMLGLVEAWNHPALFDYMDRYQQVPVTEAWHRAWVPWHAAMWDAYRAKY